MSLKHLLSVMSSDIVFLGSVASGNTTSSSYSLDLTSLTLEEDDLVITSFGTAGASGGLTLSIKDPSAVDYVTMGSTQYANSTQDSYLLTGYKVMGSSPDASVSIAKSGSGDRNIARAFAFRGVDITTPIVTYSQTTGNNTGRPTPAPLSGLYLLEGTTVTTFSVATTGAFTTAAPFTSSDLPNFNTEISQGTTLQTSLTAGWSANIPASVGVNFAPAQFGNSSTSTTNSWCSVTFILNPA